MPATSKLNAAAASPEGVKNLIDGLLAELRGAIKDEADKFFPNGIELIHVQVKVGTIDVMLKVAGEKAPKLMSREEPEPAQTLRAST